MGFTNQAPIKASRNRPGLGSTTCRMRRSQRSAKGRSKVSSILLSRMIHQVHIVDARRARSHAGKTGEAAIDICLTTCSLAGLSFFQHVLDQIDPPARAIRARRRGGRRSGMWPCRSHNGHSSVEIFSASAISGLASWARVKLVCMAQTPGYMRPGLRTRLGSKLSLTRLVNAARGAG